MVFRSQPSQGLIRMTATTTMIVRHTSLRSRAGAASNGAAVVPEWEDAELLRIMAAARSGSITHRDGRNG